MPTPTITAFGSSDSPVFGPYPDLATLLAVLPAAGHGGRLAAIGPAVGQYIYFMSMNGIWNSVGLPQLSTAPPYVKGAVYYDLGLSKLRVGGASGWETVTSA